MGKSDKKAIRVGIEMLRGARSILAIPGAWGRGWYAFNVAGRKVPIQSDDAVCFCAVGALSKICGMVRSSDLKERGYWHAISALPEYPVVVNDTSETVTPVLDMYDRAIDTLERKLSNA